MGMGNKSCERCGGEPQDKYRYCSKCRVIVVREARERGLIREVPQTQPRERLGRSVWRNSDQLTHTPKEIEGLTYEVDE